LQCEVQAAGPLTFPVNAMALQILGYPSALYNIYA